MWLTEVMAPVLRCPLLPWLLTPLGKILGTLPCPSSLQQVSHWCICQIFLVDGKFLQLILQNLCSLAADWLTLTCNIWLSGKFKPISSSNYDIICGHLSLAVDKLNVVSSNRLAVSSNSGIGKKERYWTFISLYFLPIEGSTSLWYIGRQLNPPKYDTKLIHH